MKLLRKVTFLFLLTLSPFGRVLWLFVIALVRFLTLSLLTSASSSTSAWPRVPLFPSVSQFSSLGGLGLRAGLFGHSLLFLKLLVPPGPLNLLHSLNPSPGPPLCPSVPSLPRGWSFRFSSQLLLRWSPSTFLPTAPSTVLFQLPPCLVPFYPATEESSVCLPTPRWGHQLLLSPQCSP